MGTLWESVPAREIKVGDRIHHVLEAEGERIDKTFTVLSVTPSLHANLEGEIYFAGKLTSSTAPRDKMVERELKPIEAPKNVGAVVLAHHKGNAVVTWRFVRTFGGGWLREDGVSFDRHTPLFVLKVLSPGYDPDDRSS